MTSDQFSATIRIEWNHKLVVLFGIFFAYIGVHDYQQSPGCGCVDGTYIGVHGDQQRQVVGVLMVLTLVSMTVVLA